MTIAFDTCDARRPFLSMLSTYGHFSYPEEDSILDEIREFVQSTPHCFERRRQEGAIHIAASVFLMDPKRERALFMRHTLLNRWTQPGGHADGNPDIQAVALHELEEETGIGNAVLLHPIPFEIYWYRFPRTVFGYTKSIVNCFFLAGLRVNEEPRIMEPDKCSELRWVTPDEGEELLRQEPHEGHKRLLEKWRTCLSSLKRRAS